MYIFIYLCSYVQREKQMSQINIKCLKIPTSRGQISWLLTQPAKELNSGQPRKNPVSNRVEGLNPGAADYKSSTLTTQPCCLYTFKK